jgi:hypothetical protein
MALPGSGTLTFAQIATEFSGSQPYNLSDYYRGGSLVGAGNTNVPTSGAINFSNFYGASAGITLTYSANATNVNLLTDAVAAGFNATAGGTLFVVINSGITLAGSGTHAITSGVFPANSLVTITNNGTVSGFTGASGSGGNQGSGGGDAFYANFTTSGSTWSIVNNGTWGGGGGGGGSGASRSTLYVGKIGDTYCDVPVNIGSAGEAGGLGATGATGSNGSGSQFCVNYHAGAGGAAGYAVRKNSRTISTTGTFLGTVG